MSYSLQSRSEKDLNLFLMWEDSSSTSKKTQQRAKLRLTLVKKSKLPKWSVTGLHQESEFGAGQELYLLML